MDMHTLLVGIQIGLGISALIAAAIIFVRNR